VPLLHLALSSVAGVLTAGHWHARPSCATVWAPGPPLPPALMTTGEDRQGRRAHRMARALVPVSLPKHARRAPLDAAKALDK
jgi:hypothetical protein